MFDDETLDNRDRDDATLLGLFHEWQAALRLSESIDESDSPDVYMAAVNDRFRIEDAIVATPATSSIGFIVKLFVKHFTEHASASDLDSAADDVCTLRVPRRDADGERDVENHQIIEQLELSMIADAERILPELAPLCAKVLTWGATAKGPPEPGAPLRLVNDRRERVADATGDGAILAKFADWCVQEDEAATEKYGGMDSEPNRAATAIKREIDEMPASGAMGLAIKIFLISDYENHFADHYPGLVRDLIRFAPVLEPRLRAFLDAADPEASS